MPSTAIKIIATAPERETRDSGIGFPRCELEFKESLGFV